MITLSFSKNKSYKKWPSSFYFSLAFIILLLVVALFAPWIATHPYDEQNLSIAFQSPSSQKSCER
jgi:ABC-type dipeptide/oligopeptide/nickel transport system permease subunit